MALGDGCLAFRHEIKQNIYITFQVVGAYLVYVDQHLISIRIFHSLSSVDFFTVKQNTVLESVRCAYVVCVFIDRCVYHNVFCFLILFTQGIPHPSFYNI